MTAALLVVDMQVDFVHPRGALYVPGAENICADIRALIDEFELHQAPIFYTNDWHSIDSSHFAWRGGQWPVHCVAGTSGADITENIDTTWGYMIYKGMQDDGYSAFSGKHLGSGRSFAEMLRASDVDDIYVCGVATDYCVQASVIDLRLRGYKTHVVIDCIRGVNKNPGDMERAMSSMLLEGAQFTLANDVISGRDV